VKAYKLQAWSYLIYETPVIHNYLLIYSHSQRVALLTSLGESGQNVQDFVAEINCCRKS